MTQQLLKTMLITSLAGSGLALIIAMIRPLTKKIFGYKWHYYIWLAVLVVMILPVRFTFPDKQTAPVPTINIVEMQTVPNSEAVTANYAQDTEDVPIIYAPQAPIKKSSEHLTRIIENKSSILVVIWLWGMLLMLSVSAVGYLRLIHKVHKNSVLISCPEIKKFTKRKVTVRACRDLTSPFIMGILRPSLILPDIELSAEQLDNILMHEMTHLKRHDILYKWFASFVKALHWFNPIVYYITKQINLECEISCDLSVVKYMNDTQTKNYVNTIISLLSADRAKSIPLTTGMTGNKNTLKKRFVMIKNKFFVNKRVMLASAVAAVLIFLLAISISGFLNGKWINSYDNTIIELNTDKRIGDTFNALILGLDKQNRADTLLLLRLTDTGIEGFSIPRDTVFNGKKISYILSLDNGDQKVIDAVRNQLSVPITYYAKINVDLVKDLIDIVGGLTVDIPMDMKYDDPYQDLHIDLSKGESQLLNGEQVCGLLQFRRSNEGKGYTQGDLDRIKVGQQVLTTFLSQNKLTDIVLNSNDMIESINKNVVTNYPIKSFVKDRKLLSGKKIAFYTIPGNTAVNNGIFEYEIDSAELNVMLNIPIKTDNADSERKHSAALPVLDTQLTTVYAQDSNDISIDNTPLEKAETSDKNTPLKKVETPDVQGLDVGSRINFKSIAEGEQYLQSGGAIAADNNGFKSGSNYIVNDYSFKNSRNKKIPDIVCNDNGEVSLYFVANTDALMSVSFKESETNDEVNSAVILTGNERIYKFTGLDPSKRYEVELKDMTDGEWKIEGQYLIF